MLHLLHVLRDNRTNETEVGELSRSGYTWATPDYASRQACRLAIHLFYIIYIASILEAPRQSTGQKTRATRRPFPAVQSHMRRLFAS